MVFRDASCLLIATAVARIQKPVHFGRIPIPSLHFHTTFQTFICGYQGRFVTADVHSGGLYPEASVYLSRHNHEGGGPRIPKPGVRNPGVFNTWWSESRTYILWTRHAAGVYILLGE